MARCFIERGVRFVQVYHNNWDHHSNVAGRMPSQCKDVDQPCYALLEDLKQRGMLDDTLIIWGWRIRPHHLHQGTSRRRTTVAIITRVASACGWPVVAQRVDDLRRNGRLLVQHRPRPASHPRLPRHRPQPARFRSRTIDFSLPRLGSEVDGCLYRPT